MKILSTTALATLMAFGVTSAATAQIKIGASVSETGPAAFLGDPEAKTLKMMIDDINASGGVNGEQIELIMYDDGGDPNKARTFATRLVEDHEVVAIIGGSATFSGVTVKATYGTADLGGGVDFDQTAISATYSMDALSVTGFYRTESINVFSPVDFKAYGVGASYDLGGGATLVGGIVNRKVDTLPSQTLADVGISFTF